MDVARTGHISPPGKSPANFVYIRNRTIFLGPCAMPSAAAAAKSWWDQSADTRGVK